MKKTISVFLMSLLLLMASAFAVPSLRFTNVSSTFTVNPGASFNYAYSVENDGTTNFSAFQVDFADLADLTDPTRKIFTSGTSFTFNDVANPLTPTSATALQTRTAAVPANQKAGTYRSAFSVKNGTTTYNTFNLDVTVSPAPNTTLSATQNDLVKGKTGTITVTIQNTGNTDLNLNYNMGSLSDGTNTLNPSTSAGAISVPYGQTKTVQLSFSVPTTQSAGTYKGTLTVTDGSYTDSLEITTKVRDPVRAVTVTGLNFTSLERDKQETLTVTIKNSGDDTLTNVVLSTTISSRYKPTLSSPGISSLAPGATTTTQLTITVPEDEDSGSKSLGQFQVVADNGFSQLQPITGVAESQLEISKVQVKLGGDKKKTVSEGNIVKDVEPFQDVDIVITMDNNYNVDNDMDLNEITVTILNIDDGDDIELDGDTFSIKDGKDKDETVSFDVPETVAHDDEFDVEIFVEADDENGAVHSDTFNFKLKIEKKRHEFIFKNEFTPRSLTTCTNTYTLDLSMTNLGRDDEDDVVLTIESDDLDIDVEEDVGDMSSDYDADDYKFQKFYTFNMPSSVRPGKYRVLQEVFIDTDDLEERNEFFVTVGSCPVVKDEVEDVTPPAPQPKPPVKDDTTTSSSTSTTTSDSNKDVEVITTPVTSTPAPSTPNLEGVTGDVVAATPADSSDEGLFGGSLSYVLLLVIGNLAVIAIILVLIAKVLKKKEE